MVVVVAGRATVTDALPVAQDFVWGSEATEGVTEKVQFVAFVTCAVRVIGPPEAGRVVALDEKDVTARTGGFDAAWTLTGLTTPATVATTTAADARRTKA